MFVYYRNKVDGKIEAKYKGCDTNSSKFRDVSKYERFEDSTDLPLDAFPVIVKDAPESFEIKSPDGSIWQISMNNAGKLEATKT